jgi:hypothetical protein
MILLDEEVLEISQKRNVMTKSLVDLFDFDESYSENEQLYSLKFEIPPAAELWALFDKDTVSTINEKIEDSLLESIDDTFKKGRFISMFHWGEEEELGIEINEACHKSKPSGTFEVLGKWTYLRKGRIASLEWQVPDWFAEADDKNHSMSDFDEIYNSVKDWFVFSDPEDY